MLWSNESEGVLEGSSDTTVRTLNSLGDTAVVVPVKAGQVHRDASKGATKPLPLDICIGLHFGKNHVSFVEALCVGFPQINHLQDTNLSDPRATHIWFWCGKVLKLLWSRRKSAPRSCSGRDAQRKSRHSLTTD